MLINMNFLGLKELSLLQHKFMLHVPTIFQVYFDVFQNVLLLRFSTFHSTWEMQCDKINYVKLASTNTNRIIFIFARKSKHSLRQTRMFKFH